VGCEHDRLVQRGEGQSSERAHSASALTANHDVSQDPLLPRRDLTPGDVLSATLDDIRKPGYAKSIRHVTAEMRKEVFARYGNPLGTAQRLDR